MLPVRIFLVVIDNLYSRRECRLVRWAVRFIIIVHRRKVGLGPIRRECRIWLLSCELNKYKPPVPTLISGVWAEAIRNSYDIPNSAVDDVVEFLRNLKQLAEILRCRVLTPVKYVISGLAPNFSVEFLVRGVWIDGFENLFGFSLIRTSMRDRVSAVIQLV